MKLKEVYILLFVFLISIIIRIPNLNRPLSKHHEFNAAFFLIPMEVWDQSSGFNYNFNPVMNYQNSGDKGINNFAATDTEKNGDFYYLSFGSGAYIFPYFFMQAFGGPNVLSLQVFSLLVHLITAILLVLLTKTIFQQISVNSESAIFAGVLYLLLPHTLWFHGNGYTHHSLVICFFIATCLGLLKGLTFGWSKKYLFLYCLSLFLTIYTEWLGCFLAFTNVVFVFFYFRKSLPKVLIASVMTTILAVAVIFCQASASIGSLKYLTYLSNRFLVRSELSEGFSSMIYFAQRVCFWFTIGFLPLFVLLFFFKFKLKIDLKLSSIFKFLILMISPIWLHHFVFSGFTAAHDYSVLIDATYLCVCFAYFCVKANVPAMQKTKKSFLVVAFLLVSCTLYYGINRPGAISQRGDNYDRFQLIGSFLKSNVQKDEVIFIQGLKDLPNPQVIFYAKRNFHAIEKETDIKNILAESPLKKAFFVEVKKDQVIRWRRLGN
jgi:hypothetical protein